MTATVFDNPEKGVGVSEELGVCVCVYERDWMSVCVTLHSSLNSGAKTNKAILVPLQEQNIYTFFT